MRGLPWITISAEYGRKLDDLLDASFEVYETWNARVSTGKLNRWLQEKTEAHPPPLAKGRRVRLRYMTQVKTRPPTFAAFVSQPTELPEAYTRYLVNGLREDFGLVGVPIRFMILRWTQSLRKAGVGRMSERRRSPDSVTIDDLARAYDLLLEVKKRRYYRRWEVETRTFRKRKSAVVQDDNRLQRLKDRAEGIRFALGYEDLTYRQRTELEQTLRNLELAICGTEATRK